MKILFLTDEFYPNFGANSLLVKTLAEELISNGQEVLVMPFSYGRNLSREEDYNGIKIVRSILHDDKQSLIFNVKKARLVSALKIGWKILKQKLSKKQSVLSKDRISARKILENFINENNIDVVVSICCSIELSFSLLYLRKKEKLSCKWVFYMIDPFESHEFYRGIENVKTLRKIQHEIMENCDNVIATNLIHEDVKAWETKEILEKISVLEFPKIVKPVLKPCDDDITLEKDKLNVVCTGSKNEKVRNSDYAIELCKGLKDTNVHCVFVGKGWSDEQVYNRDNLFFYKPKSHQSVINLQLNSDFLLNIGNSVNNQLPSKVLEYISTGKPIINVAKSKECPTVKLLEGANAITVFETQPLNEALNKIKEFIFKNNSKTEFNKISIIYKEYTPEFVAEKFLSLIRGVK